jgi:hypothetical protein
MAIGWQLAGPARHRVPPAAPLIVAGVLAVLAIVGVLAVTDHRPPGPVRVDAGRSDAARPAGARADMPTAAASGTATAAATGASAEVTAGTGGRAEASSEHSVSVVDGVDGRPTGIVVTNSGAATADVGGNVVVGSDEPAGPGGSSAGISTGDATAVGNESSTRVAP